MAETKTILCEIMNKEGSDKGNGHHNYTIFYDSIFSERKDGVELVFELGLGTNNKNIPSNMGGRGQPGGSLRGWRAYFKNAEIYGADIDRKILFSEDRITTFYCDQTDPQSIKAMWEEIDKKFDIIIEDGVHTFEANEIFFLNSIDYLKDGGIFIIEDIRNSDLSIMRDFIEQCGHEYKTMRLVELYNSRNNFDNNLLVVEK